MKPRLAVTGSTGALGGAVAKILATQDIPQRLVVRDPSRAPRYTGAIAVGGVYEDESVTAALDGVTTLFMVSLPESADRVDHHRTFVQCAARAGVDHIVYTSIVGTAPEPTLTLARDHYATEEAIKASGMSYTFLRDNLYLDFLPALVGEDGVIRGPAGSGRVATVARQDIARSAVAVLVDVESHRGATYELTGPEALTMDDIAATLTELTGRSIRFCNETLEEAYRSRAGWNAPSWQVDAWVSTYTAIAAGEMAQVSSAVEQLTGKPPLSLRDFLAQ